MVFIFKIEIGNKISIHDLYSTYMCLYQFRHVLTIWELYSLNKENLH